MKVTVDGVEFPTTGDALNFARRIEMAVEKAKVESKPSFSVTEETTYYLYCSWCKKFVYSAYYNGDMDQAEWEHMAKEHPGAEHI